MSVREAVNFRRAVRRYRDEPLDADVVRDCLRLAQLAPSSSNMQLWQVFHVTSPAMLRRLTEACLGQGTARTAQQMVVFVTRQDLYREHACQVFAQESANVRATSPKERHDHRLRRLWLYYARVMPLYYARFHGAAGIARKGLASAIGLVRPMVREVTESDANAVCTSRARWQHRRSCWPWPKSATTPARWRDSTASRSPRSSTSPAEHA